jgi:polyisoprenyl-phosphate glycosyltransferase
MVESVTVAEKVQNGEEITHTISVVIPVYQGEKTLSALMDEIEEFTSLSRSPDDYPYVVSEVLLVYDNGPDGSATTIRALTAAHDFVRSVWLSKNYGQHAATLAGMASTGGDWIVTLDEDGQHNPRDIGRMLDAAMREGASVVYSKPTNPPPHGVLRNAASRGAKWLLTKFFAGSNAPDFQSYRLILGNVGRSVAAYSGSGVYLDVAMGWVAGKATTCPIELRSEGGRPSGYSTRRLLSHFWKMVLSSGTRGLRFVSALGIILAVFGVLVTIYILLAKLWGGGAPSGWASTIVVTLLSAGAILFSLGIIAEYIGVNVNMAMGKPPYLITSDPADGPLGRAHNNTP